MKVTSTIALVAFSALAVCADEKKNATGADLKPIVISERPTHAALVKRQNKEIEHNKQKTGGAEIKPVVTIKKRSLMDSSTILATGSNWAIVPKGSVIHIPDHLKSKIASKPQGRLQEWPVFLRANAGWIHLHSIPLKQAHGQEFLGEEKMKAYKSIGKVVVAVSGGHPISVAPQAFIPPAEEADKK